MKKKSFIYANVHITSKGESFNILITTFDLHSNLINGMILPCIFLDKSK